ncbi:MAG: glycosyltransferase [Ignavibacteriaceae bacterium]|nr:glycosyltransferase [Ignavibacteriaceae bacterium]
MMQSNNKILMIIADSHSPDARLTKEINSLFDNGYNVDVICWDRENKHLLPPYKSEKHGEVFRYKLPSKRGNPALFILNIGRFYLFAIKKSKLKKYTIIHAHSIQVLIVAVFLKFFLKLKLIYDVHEVTETFGNNLITGLGKLFWQIEKLFLPFVDGIITATDPLTDRYKNKIKKNGNVISVLNCLPFIERNFIGRSINSEDKFIIGRIGNLRNKSRIDIIAEVINILIQRKLNVKLILAGTNIAGYELKSKNIIDSLGDFVEYHDWIPLDKFKDYYGLFDIVINIHEKGDVYEEKYAYFSKVFESISFGVPVVINDFPTMTNFVNDNEVGFVIKNISAKDFADQIEFLIKHPNIKNEMRGNCLKVSKDIINWKIMEERLLKLYSTLIS